MAVHAARRSGGAPVIPSVSPFSSFSSRYSAHSPPSLHSPSPTGSISVTSGRPEKPAAASIKRTCLCSPTNHPGSFRCSLHKGGGPGNISSGSKTASYGGSGRLNMMRRSAMKNSPVRIGTAEGDLVRRSLVALIRPSSHQQRLRGGDFRCRPSRLSVMSKA